MKQINKFVIKTIGELGLWFIIIPVIFVFISKDIMLVIIYFQLLVIWSQAEVAERQNAILLAQFEPSFRVTLGENLELIIENISQNPAYDVGISRVLHENGKPVPPEEWRKELDWPEEPFIQCLSPGEKGVLCYFIPPGTLENYFLNKVIEVSYWTRMGQDGVIYVIPLPGGSFRVIHPSRELPGYLHKLFEDLRILKSLRKLRRLAKSESYKN